MPNQSLTIPFVNPTVTRSTKGELILEPVPWDNYTGRVTKGAIVAYLRSLMYGAEKPEMDCGLGAAGYSCMVLAYPSTPNLVYQIDITNGELSERTVEEIDFTELINVSLTDTIDLKFPAREILSAEFVGNGYDRSGTLVLAPSVTMNEDGIILSYPVYGALKVRYRVIVHGYTATVTKREDVAEHYYDSTVYARWTGGVTWLTLEPPVGAEEYATSEAGCGFGGGGGTVEFPDQDIKPPVANDVHRIIKIDYCSQTIISDTSY